MYDRASEYYLHYVYTCGCFDNGYSTQDSYILFSHVYPLFSILLSNVWSRLRLTTHILQLSPAYLLFGFGNSWAVCAAELADIKAVPQNIMNAIDIVK